VTGGKEKESEIKQRFYMRQKAIEKEEFNHRFLG